MDNLRKAMIEELMLTLKIPQGSFNFGTISDAIRNIKTNNLRYFYKSVVGSNSFGNGMKAILDSAETFRPEENTNVLTEDAKRLILFIEYLKEKVSQDSIQKKIPFSDLIKCLNLEKMYSQEFNKTFAVLRLVKPYRNVKDLIINISHYPTTIDALNAFKMAIREYEEILKNPLLKNGNTKDSSINLNIRADYSRKRIGNEI